MKVNLKFKTKIILSSLLSLFAALIIISLWQYQKTVIEIESMMNGYLSELTETHALTIENELDFRVGINSNIASLIQSDSRESQIRHIINVPPIKKAFGLIGFVYSDTGKYFSNNPDFRPTYDIRAKEEWYKTAVAQNKTIIGDIKYSPYLKRGYVTMATPIKKNGKTMGVFFADLKLDYLYHSVLAKHKVYKDGMYFAVSKNGTTVLHPELGKTGQPITKYWPDINIELHHQYLTRNGKKYIATLYPIKLAPWTIGMIVAEDEVIPEPTRLKRDSMITTAAAMLLSMISIYIFVRILLRPLNQVRKALYELSSGHGDLTKRLNTKTDAEFSKIANNFNLFTEKLQNLLSETVRISDGIKRDTNESAELLTQSNSNIEEQLNQVEQLATAMDEMASTATNVAENAQNASGSAQNAEESANAGIQVVGTTSEAVHTLALKVESADSAMQSLNKNVLQIEKSLKSVADIAEQTNLLALNAAIEAARADENGRGFAVVADEVRTLAKSTQESTSQIKRMIETLEEGTLSAAEVMAKSNDSAARTLKTSVKALPALQNIKDSIKVITDMNLQIAAAAEEQSKVAEEINAKTIEIKDLSRSTSERSTEIQSQMDTQVQDVEEQAKIFGEFKI